MNLQESIRNDLNKLDEGSTRRFDVEITIKTTVQVTAENAEYAKQEAEMMASNGELNIVGDNSEVTAVATDHGDHGDHGDVDNTKKKFNPILLKPVEDVGFSVRDGNMLKQAQLYYVGDVIQYTKDELYRFPSLHSTRTLDQIIAVLNDLGLQLGTDIPNWPPSDLMQG